MALNANKVSILFMAYVSREDACCLQADGIITLSQ
jgi:hypothetical protein